MERDRKKYRTRQQFCPALVSFSSFFFPPSPSFPPPPPSFFLLSRSAAVSLVSGSQRREIYCRHREPIHGLFYLCCTCTFTAKRWFAPSTDQASSSSGRDRYNDIGIGATNECGSRERVICCVFSAKNWRSLVSPLSTNLFNEQGRSS